MLYHHHVIMQWSPINFKPEGLRHASSWSRLQEPVQIWNRSRTNSQWDAQKGLIIDNWSLRWKEGTMMVLIQLVSCVSSGSLRRQAVELHRLLIQPCVHRFTTLPPMRSERKHILLCPQSACPHAAGVFVLLILHFLRSGPTLYTSQFAALPE